jgi:hypothetical protein
MQIATPRPATRGASIVAVLLIIGIACVTLTRAQTRPATSESLIINVFDIRDLLVDRHLDEPASDAPNWPFSDQPTTGSSVRAFAGRPSTAASRQQLVDSVIKQIQRAVDPTGWNNDSLPPSLRPGIPAATPSIREFNGQLIIAQTPTNLAAIKTMLDATREEMSRQITVETRYITSEQAIDNATPDGQWKSRGEGVDVWSEFLTDDQLATLNRSIQSRQHTTTLTAPRVTLFNKQRANIVVGQEMDFIADYKASTDGKLEPVLKKLNSGVLIDLRAEMRPDLESATIKLDARVSELLNMKREPWPKPPAPQQADIQVPTLQISRINLITDIWADQTLLIRVQPKIEPPDPTIAPPKPVYFLVRPKLIFQREQAGTADFPVLRP